MKTLILYALLCSCVAAHASTLNVGAGKQYARLQAAAADVRAGDTILIYPGIYTGGDFISNLYGTANKWITITSTEKGSTIFRGGSQAFHVSKAAYIRFEGLVFEQQTGNGVNIDDGGTLETPTHHIRFENCEWRSMNATGNNDELKISGVDDFVITTCKFANGSAGGSMVDMVGCHRGSFLNNVFDNAGSNAIQAKGGSSDILIFANKFLNGGQRAINIGGSTGLDFFRPKGANYEAKSIIVHSNIFVGSVTPIAFVGAINSYVENNTIYKPTSWAMRILQETTEQGFLPCGNNGFRNNIIVYGNTGTVAINVGGNTAPETFSFEYNLWYNPDNATWQGPNTPVTEINRILNKNPMFTDTISFRILPQSPAWKAGSSASKPQRDFYGNLYSFPRSVGAVEFVNPTNVTETQSIHIVVQPNPASEVIRITSNEFGIQSFTIFDIHGTTVTPTQNSLGTQYDIAYNCSHLASGIYYVRLVTTNAQQHVIPVHIVR